MQEVIKKIGKNSIYNLIGKVVSTLLSIILVFFIARELGPKDYGLFSLTITFSLVVYQLTSSGLEISLPYFMQKYKSKSVSIIHKFVKMQLVIITISALILFLSSKTIANIYNIPELELYIQISALFLPFFVIMQASYYIFQGLNNLKPAMNVDILFSIAKFIALVLILLNYSVAGALIGYGISYVIVNIYIFKKYRDEKSSNQEFIETKEMLKYSSTYVLSSVLYILSNYLVNILLGADPINLGFFDSANKIGLLITLLPGALTAALIPNITGKTVNEIKELTSRLLKYIAIFIAPVLTVLLFVSDFIIITVLGSDYASITNVFKIVCIMLSFQAFNSFFEGVSQGAGKPRNTLIQLLIKTVVIVLLSSYLTNAFNASIIILIATVSVYFYFSVSIRKLLRNPWKDYLKVLASVSPLIIALNMNFNLATMILLFITSMTFYIVMIYYKVFDFEDKSLLNKLLNKLLNALLRKQ